MRTTAIRITEVNTEIPTALYLEKFMLLRKCRKVGDSEVVNNYQLGRLNEAKRNGSINFEKI